MSPSSGPTPAALDRLRALDTCAVSDALDTLGLNGATTGIGPLWSSPAPIAGRVRTVLAGPSRARPAGAAHRRRGHRGRRCR